MNIVAVVGFGEAGQAFAKGWSLDRSRIRAFDIKAFDPAKASELQQAYKRLSVDGRTAAEDALRGASTVFCLVPADQALVAARDMTSYLDAGALWIDGSSSAPSTKLQAAHEITKGGAHYVDMAIMAPVIPKLHRTPVLLSGKEAKDASDRLASLGMEVTVVGPDVGDASSVKMLRSIMVKGIEALTAECFLAARKAGVELLVLESLTKSGELVDWRQRTAYNLERMLEHGARRAAEMREVATTLQDLNMPDWMASATALWQERLAGRGDLGDGEFEHVLDVVLAKMN